MTDAEREKPYSTEVDDQGEGSPPRHPSSPEGSESSTKTPKTRTDPATGEPSGGRPDTAG